MDGDWEDAVAYADDLLGDIGDLPEEAEDFANGVMETVEGIRGTIDSTESVTDRQWTALQNIRGGVDKWKRN